MAPEKLLIVDSSEEFCDALQQALQTRFQVQCCCDSNSALTLLREESFDILVLNLVLPGKDGLYLLEQAASEGISPKILALTPFFSDYILNSVENLNVSYIMLKPCEIPAVVRRVCDLNRPIRAALPTRDMYAYLSQLLASFPMKPNLLGFKLLRAAILLSVQNPNMSATKELYPAAAAFCRRPGCNVERNMRTALDGSWRNPNREVWLTYFPPSENRPESSTFIARIAEDLRLKLSQGLLDPWEFPEV